MRGAQRIIRDHCLESGTGCAFRADCVRGARSRRRGGLCRSLQARARIADLDRGCGAKREQDDERRAYRELDQGLSSTHAEKVSFCISTWACTGNPLPSPTGTSAGTEPPMSTCIAEPRSVAQTQTDGAAPDCPGHQAPACTPTRLGERARIVTSVAICEVDPATAAARAPARAADLTAKDSALHTASSTHPSASSRATGHVRANSRMAAPRAEPAGLNASSSGALRPRETSRLPGTGVELQSPPEAERCSAHAGSAQSARDAGRA